MHDVDEFAMLVDGDVETEIDGDVHRPAAGEEPFVPAGTRHAVRNLGRDESRWLDGYRR